MKLGAQFFSIRDRSQTPEDLYASFAKMKEIGYEIVQMSGICKIEAATSFTIISLFFAIIHCFRKSAAKVVKYFELCK